MSIDSNKYHVGSSKQSLLSKLDKNSYKAFQWLASKVKGKAYTDNFRTNETRMVKISNPAQKPEVEVNLENCLKGKVPEDQIPGEFYTAENLREYGKLGKVSDWDYLLTKMGPEKLKDFTTKGIRKFCEENGLTRTQWEQLVKEFMRDSAQGLKDNLVVISNMLNLDGISEPKTSEQRQSPIFVSFEEVEEQLRQARAISDPGKRKNVTREIFCQARTKKIHKNR